MVAPNVEFMLAPQMATPVQTSQGYTQWPTKPALKPTELCLVYHSSDQPKDGVQVEVRPNEEFDIGRQQFRDALGIQDRCVSNHHLRIRCISYEDEENQVDPMVYMAVLSSNAVILTRYGFDEPHEGVEVGRDQGDVLLSEGDRVQVTNRLSMSLHRYEGSKSNPPPLDHVRQKETTRFADRYRLTSRVLGIGGYAAVYVAVKQSSGQQLACKIVSLTTKGPDAHGRHQPDSEKIRLRQEATAREYNVLKNLSHPNIVSLEKVFRTSHNVYIFQELITGGDLLSFLDTKDRLTEVQAVVIVRQLLEAVNYLHRNQVVHRDIKPENILMTSWRDGARVVLTDFGQSRTIVDLEKAAKSAGIGRMHSLVGTYGYTAPEVFHQMKRDLQEGSGYSKAIDMWSIGCVTAMLLTNQHIFPDGRDLVSGITTLSQFSSHLNVLDSGSKIWDKVGKRAKSFLRGCLSTKEEDRLTASEGLKHLWFTHPRYHVEFDAAYQRSIQDWRPRHHDADLVEFLDTSDIPVESNKVRSRHFARERSGPTAELHASPAVVPDTPRRDFSVQGNPLRSSPPQADSQDVEMLSQVDDDPRPPWRTSTIPYC